MKERNSNWTRTGSIPSLDNNILNTQLMADTVLSTDDMVGQESGFQPSLLL